MQAEASQEEQGHTEATEQEQGHSGEAAPEEDRCKATRTIYDNTTNDVPGCPKGGLLSGTNRRDKLDGEDGDDEIRGLGGDDEVLWGGSGSDVIYGVPGDDFLYSFGSQGPDDTSRYKDVLYGGSGSDTMYGDKGADVLYGRVATIILSPTEKRTSSIAVQAGTHTMLTRAPMCRAAARRASSPIPAVLP